MCTLSSAPTMLYTKEHIKDSALCSVKTASVDFFGIMLMKIMLHVGDTDCPCPCSIQQIGSEGER